MGEKAAWKWRLAEILKEEGLSPYRLWRTTTSASQPTIYRWARGKNVPRSIDLATMAEVITALRQLTGRRYDIGDILTLDGSDVSEEEV